MSRIAASAILLVASVSSLLAQQPKPGFEVASVRPQTPGAPFTPGASMVPRAYPGGVFRGSHASVLSLLMFAYDMKSYQISEEPEWIRQDYFDINARAGRADTPVEEMRLMMQSLLEDRFKLVARVERRETRVQALTLARTDGRRGPSLLPIDECSSAVVNELRRKFPEQYPGPIGNGMVGGCTSAGLGELADLLSIGLEVPVVDASGLQGSFYYTLRSQFSVIPALFRRLPSTSTDSDLPSLPTALEEQLGLKLESRRAQLPMLVIESVERPTEN